jgi:hypothetical protein
MYKPCLSRHIRKNRAKRLKQDIFSILTLISRKKPLNAQIISYSGVSNDVRILYNGVLFLHARTSDKLLQQIPKPNRKFFPTPRIFLRKIVDNKVFPNNHHLYYIHKYSISRALKLNTA